jgi:diacylglycerol kinase family enzyme
MLQRLRPLADPVRIPAILNVDSGSAPAAREALGLSDAFDVHAVTPDAIESTIRVLGASGAKRVLVAGGDGTIATAAAALLGTSTELAILPGGTLNHFARDLGISTVAAEALELAGNPGTRTVDVGMLNGRVFLNTSSVGAYVRFVRTRERMERTLPYGLASVVAGVRLLTTVRRMGVEIEIDGRVRLFRTPLVFIGVGERELQFPTLGRRVKDGRRGLHVMVIRGRSRTRLVAIALTALFRGLEAVSRSGHFETIIVDRFRITLRGAGYVAVDGEIAVLETPLEYSLRRDALSVVCRPP